MLVGLHTFPGILPADSKLFIHLLDDWLIDLHDLHSDVYPFGNILLRHQIEPRVLPDLLNIKPLLGICI